MADKYQRRDFLKQAAAVGGALVLGGIGSGGCANLLKRPASVARACPLDVVRVGFVGVGLRGTHLLKLFLAMEGVEVRAVGDIVEEKVVNARQLIQQAGQPEPEGFSRGETDYKRMCQRNDLDLIVIATPWQWHVPMCVEAINTGKHAAPEVPAAVTLDECWQLVETAEKYKRYCVMLENCCYGRSEMMVLNMVRKGLLGELVHAQAGYLHDLRELKFSGRDEGLWRTQHSIERNGNLYPTHGLGPVAQCMNINRGDRFDYLVSASSKSRGLNLYAAQKFGPDSPQAGTKYALGDVNSSLIRTVNGATIVLIHDCDTPRPYSRINLVQGTKGIFSGYPDRIYIEGRSPQHEWEPADTYLEEYDHPLWKALGDKAAGSGHGGMDYMIVYRLVRCLREGILPDMDVYDAASWSAVAELSERSVAGKSRAVDFPDFTRGEWKTNPALGIVEI